MTRQKGGAERRRVEEFGEYVEHGAEIYPHLSA